MRDSPDSQSRVIFTAPGKYLLSGVPEGMDAYVLSRQFGGEKTAAHHLHVARDDARMAALAEGFRF